MSISIGEIVAIAFIIRGGLIASLFTYMCYSDKCLCFEESDEFESVEMV